MASKFNTKYGKTVILTESPNPWYKIDKEDDTKYKKRPKIRNILKALLILLSLILIFKLYKC